MSLVDFYIDPTQICIFSKTSCGYCSRAKQLLNNDYTVNAQVIELDRLREGPTIATDLRNKTGLTTVPNIFIFGKHIGGYSELKELHDSGMLRTIIQKKPCNYLCSFCGKCSPTKKLECSCFPQHFADWVSPY